MCRGAVGTGGGVLRFGAPAAVHSPLARRAFPVASATARASGTGSSVPSGNPLIAGVGSASSTSDSRCREDKSSISSGPDAYGWWFPRATAETAASSAIAGEAGSAGDDPASTTGTSGTSGLAATSGGSSHPASGSSSADEATVAGAGPALGRVPPCASMYAAASRGIVGVRSSGAGRSRWMLTYGARFGAADAVSAGAWLGRGAWGARVASNPPSCVGTASSAAFAAADAGVGVGDGVAVADPAGDGVAPTGDGGAGRGAAPGGGEPGPPNPIGLGNPRSVAERKSGFANPGALGIGGRGGAAAGGFGATAGCAGVLIAVAEEGDLGATAGAVGTDREGIKAPGAGATPVFATNKEIDSFPVDSPTVERAGAPGFATPPALGPNPREVGRAGAFGMDIDAAGAVGASGGPAALAPRWGGTVGARRDGSGVFAFAPSPLNVPRPGAAAAGFGPASFAGGATLPPGRGRGTDSGGRGDGEGGLMRETGAGKYPGRGTRCTRYAPEIPSKSGKNSRSLAKGG